MTCDHEYQYARDIMLMGGNAVDSAIATMYCNTVVNSQSMGIGGGFIMTIYLGNGTKVTIMIIMIMIVMIMMMMTRLP